MKKKRKAPNVAVVQLTEGALSFSVDFTKLDDGVLEEIVEMAKRQLARRTAPQHLKKQPGG